LSGAKPGIGHSRPAKPHPGFARLNPGYELRALLSNDLMTHARRVFNLDADPGGDIKGGVRFFVLFVVHRAGESRAMHRRHAAILLATVALAVTQAAHAQPSPASTDTFKSVVGKWEISNADRDRICNVTFRPDPSGAVFKLELDKGCTAQMPELKDVVAWTIGGLDLVRLVDAKGRPVMEFSEVESGTFEAQRPGEGVFFMQTAAVAASPVGLSTDQMAGDWNLVRGSGRSVCTITLTNAAAGADSFSLKLNPGCDAFVTRFGPTAWYMDRGELVLRSRANQFWRFEENDPTNWQRVPEGRESITLVRQ
jgi:hypothetical protein